MKEQLITFETAKLANKKGFIGGGTKRYNRKGLLNESKAWSISAPTQSLLQKWLREKHNLNIVLFPFNNQTQWFYGVNKIEWIVCKRKVTFSTYEEALEKGLQEALKLI